MLRQVVFSHGKESGPWGTKIVALAELATAAGHGVASIDYQGIDAPEARVQRLLEHCKEHCDQPILVGSSMGGHVAAAASRQVRAAGLFLMAPAFYMLGYEALTPIPATCPITIVHGWRDDIVPVENSVRYAQTYRATLHLMNADHRMQEQIPEICAQFQLFLRACNDRFI
jgi:pimeloyl-ACP methyl ester carboxylesterase